MSATLLGAEPTIRLAAFAATFAVLALMEALTPRRAQEVGRRWRWPSNLGVVVVDALAVRLLFPTAVVGLALWVEARGWGLFHLLAWPTWVEVTLSLLVLDLAVWCQHVLFHRVPVLWRVHRMHHADLEFDVTTGVRFHPVEIVLSILIKFGVVALIGAPPVAVLAFEVLLNATSMFSHSNLRLPEALDAVLRRVIVTPDMHRVHHSVAPRETHSNFGFNLSWWDRLFGTYRAQPEGGHEGMTLGLPLFRDRSELRLDRMLLQPFRRGRRVPEGQAGSSSPDATARS